MKVSYEAPSISITPLAMAKVRHWVKLASGEISCMGLVDRDGHHFLITDVQLLEQECSSAETELKAEALAALQMDLHDAGIPGEKLRCWIHSHNNMDTFWSGTDEKAIETLNNGEWLISIVVNKAGKSRARLDVFSPIHVQCDEVELQIIVDYPDIEEHCKEEFKAKVKEKSYSCQVWGRSGGQNLGSGMTGERPFSRSSSSDRLSSGCSHKDGQSSYREYRGFSWLEEELDDLEPSGADKSTKIEESTFDKTTFAAAPEACPGRTGIMLKDQEMPCFDCVLVQKCPLIEDEDTLDQILDRHATKTPDSSGTTKRKGKREKVIR